MYRLRLPMLQKWMQQAVQKILQMFEHRTISLTVACRDSYILNYIGSMYRSGSRSARPHGVQLSAQPSTPVPRRPLPVCIQCRLHGTTPSLCQPRSFRRASLSSQQLRSAGFFCGRSCDMELVTRQYIWETRPSAETPSDVHWRRFYF